MQHYSARFIGSDGQIMQRIDLLCADEADAHQQTRQLVEVDAVELWQQDRLVATFVPCLRAPLN
jgi:hypothetical protein